MSEMSAPMTGKPLAVVELSAKDLPAYCAIPQMPLGDHHPRVFIDATNEGGGKCPCGGTVYRLRAGEVVKGHH